MHKVTVGEIEASGFCITAVNQEGCRTHPLTQLKAPFNGIAKQCRTNPSSLGSRVHGKPSEEQLRVQRELRDAIEGILVYANYNIDDSRAKSLGMTAGEDMLMWLGKAIFQPEGVK